MKPSGSQDYNNTLPTNPNIGPETNLGQSPNLKQSISQPATDQIVSDKSQFTGLPSIFDRNRFNQNSPFNQGKLNYYWYNLLEEEEISGQAKVRHY